MYMGNSEVESMEEIILTAISTVGFPIVAFFMMYKLNSDVISKNTEALNDLKEAIKDNR